MKTSRTVFFVATTGVLLAAGASSRSARASGCVNVFGHYVATFTANNCTSPVGLCATGSVTLAIGDLNLATTTFSALDVEPSAGLPAAEPAANVSYSGTLTFTTPNGDTLTVRDMGVVDGVHSYFTELERPASGTGIFAGATGDFFISGALLDNQAGFDGHLSGQLCGL